MRSPMSSETAPDISRNSSFRAIANNTLTRSKSLISRKKCSVRLSKSTDDQGEGTYRVFFLISYFNYGPLPSNVCRQTSGPVRQTDSFPKRTGDCRDPDFPIWAPPNGISVKIHW